MSRSLRTAAIAGLAFGATACSGDLLPAGTLRVDPIEADGLEAGAVPGQLLRVRYSGPATEFGTRLVFEGPEQQVLETRDLFFVRKVERQTVDLDFAVNAEFQHRKLHGEVHAWMEVREAVAFSEGATSALVELTDDLPPELGGWAFVFNSVRVQAVAQ